MLIKSQKSDMLNKNIEGLFIINLTNHHASVLFVADELQKYGIDVQATTESGFDIDIIAALSENKTIRLIVRKVSDNNSTNISKNQMDVSQDDLYVAIHHTKGQKRNGIYLFPAALWKDKKAPFLCNDYISPELKSKPEWTINFSDETIEAISSYRLDSFLRKMGLSYKSY